MRIKGLSERTPKAVFAAVFKKGAVKEANRPGVNLDHFRLDWSSDWNSRYVSLNPDAIARYIRIAIALHGRPPTKEFLETLNNEDSILAIDLFSLMYGFAPKSVVITNVQFDASMKKFGGKTMIWRCDGEQICTHWTEGGYSNIPKPCEAPGGVLEACKDKNGCDFSGELRFQVPEFSALCGRIVHFVLYTKSPNEVAAISDLVDRLAERTNLAEIPFELYRYEASFTIPIKGKPSKTTQSMVGLMPFAVSQLQQLENKETTIELPRPVKQLSDGQDDEKTGHEQAAQAFANYDTWLGEMDSLFTPTLFDGFEAFLTALYESREDATDVSGVLSTIYGQWENNRKSILDKIFHGLAELQAPLLVDRIYVYDGKKMRYEIIFPFGAITIWTLDEFRRSGYEDIDTIKQSPLAMINNREYKTDALRIEATQQLESEGVVYLNGNEGNQSEWVVPMAFLDGVHHEAEYPYIPITLKQHKKNNGQIEIQLSIVLEDVEGDVAF